jgi:hypothetical protein
MHKMTASMWIAMVALLVQPTFAWSYQCSNSEYATFKRYDSYLDANPTIDDDRLRANFAARVGMRPVVLKDLYFRCLSRWTAHEPQEAQKVARDALASMAAGGEAPLTKGHSCNTLGFRFGHTGTSAMLRKQPNLGWDFVMPERCRGKPDTNAGITAGTKAAAN